MSIVRSIFSLRTLITALVWTLTPFVPGVIIRAYSKLTGSNIDSADQAGGALLDLLLKSLDYPFDHPDRILWFALIVLGVLVAYSHGIPFAKRAWNRRLLLQHVGIRAYIKRDSAESKNASWDDCIKHVTGPDNDTIYLMGANGWDTFGKPDAPLHRIIENFRGSVCIMLLHPYSQWTEVRAANAREAVHTYRTNIKRSVVQCKKWKSQGNHIDIALFDWPPVWKLIFSHDRLWLQHYEDGRAVDNTPVYSFGRDPNPGSLYHPFRSDFERMWDRAEKIDLTLSNSEIERRWLAVDTHLPPAGNCGQCPGALHRIPPRPVAPGE